MDIIPIRLSELTTTVTSVISSAFNNRHYWVIAEITNHSFYSQKGHHYFHLVEKADNGVQIVAKMEAVAWMQGNNSIKEFERITGQKFKNDIQVLAKVLVEYHASYGLKLVMVAIDTSFTIGALEKQKQETLTKLANNHPDFIKKVDDKYITRNNSLPLPSVIQNIAVITSSSSAGLQDFSHTVHSNSFGYLINIDPYYTVVQGESKAKLFYDKLLDVYNSRKKYDAVIIIRGGGAQTDFLIFDQYNLGMIVAKFPIPIITGIGHHKNETIVDLMANTSTKTPTKAAEFIVAHNRAFEEKVLAAQKTIVIWSQQILTKHIGLLNLRKTVIIDKTRTIIAKNKDTLIVHQQTVINSSRMSLFEHSKFLTNTASLITATPKSIVSNKLNDLKNIISNIKIFKYQFLKNQLGYLNHYNSVTKMMSPENILKKGFAIVKLNDSVISKADNLEIGTDYVLIFNGSELKSTVKSKRKYDGRDFDI